MMMMVMSKTLTLILKVHLKKVIDVTFNGLRGVFRTLGPRRSRAKIPHKISRDNTVQP
jgi:hypothetical protein